MAELRDRLMRSWLPSALLALRRARLGRRAASLALKLGRRPRMELYFAFDDPYAAVALPALLDRFASRATLILYPIVERGLPPGGDPQEQASLGERRARYALLDARRLLGRGGPEAERLLGRREPLLREDGRRAAELTEALRGRPEMAPFARRALSLFFLPEDPTPPADEALSALYEELSGARPPPPRATEERLQGNARRLRRFGGWESPTLRIGEEQFFAHERLEAIQALLDEVGA